MGKVHIIQCYECGWKFATEKKSDKYCDDECKKASKFEKEVLRLKKRLSS